MFARAAWFHRDIRQPSRQNVLMSFFARVLECEMLWRRQSLRRATRRQADTARSKEPTRSQSLRCSGKAAVRARCC